MGSAAKRMRDTFYMNMWEEHQLEKSDVIQILKEADIDVSSFDVKKISRYEEAIENHMMKKRILEKMKPIIKHIPCPYPNCNGEKIEYTRSGKTLWYCTDGGNKHRVIWRASKIRALFAVRRGDIKEEELNDSITKYIKEYEEYAKKKDSRPVTV